MRLVMFCCTLLLAAVACGDDDAGGSTEGEKPDAATHTGTGGTGGGGDDGGGSGGSSQPGSGGRGGAHDASTMHEVDAGDDDAGRGDAGAAQPCEIDASDPSVPGVTLHVESDRCRIPFGEGQVFTWKLELSDTIDYTTVDSGGACGRCAANDSEASSLVSYAIEGEHERYCECDVGCCPPTTAHAASLAAGSASHEIDWPGRVWGGPSDTNEPLGAFFPIGHYAVKLTFDVPGVATLTASLPIEIVANTGMHSGPAACDVGGQVYPSGAEGIKDPRSCNHCSCLDGELTACTEINCPEVCPADAIFGTDCQQCGPVDNCEIVRTGCLYACTDQSDCATYGGVCVSGACRMVCG